MAHFTSGPVLNLTGPNNLAIACNNFSGKSWDEAFTPLVPDFKDEFLLRAHGTEGYTL